MSLVRKKSRKNCFLLGIMSKSNLHSLKAKSPISINAGLTLWMRVLMLLIKFKCKFVYKFSIILAGWERDVTRKLTSIRLPPPITCFLVIFCQDREINSGTLKEPRLVWSSFSIQAVNYDVFNSCSTYYFQDLLVNRKKYGGKMQSSRTE